MEFENLFKPMKIKGIELKNRIISAPFMSNYAERDGSVSKKMLERYARLASGGVAMVVVEATCVDPKGMGFPLGPRIDRDELIEDFSKLSKIIKDAGAVAALQIFHAGRFSAVAQPLAPSPVPFSPVPMVTYNPKEMDKDEIKSAIQAFARAALRVKKAGFDMVELHGATGYLISSFVSPHTNRRTDEYGGSLENRMRFPLEVLEAVKAEVGDFPVGYRFMADELLPHGLKIEESKIFAKELEKAGIAYLSVTAGTYESYILPEVEEIWRKEGNAVPLGQAIKEVVSIPVFIAGRIVEPQLAEGIIKEGKADCIALGRPLFADPEYPRKAFEGRPQDIIRCIACGLCTNLVSIQNKPAVCSQWKKKERKYTAIAKRIPRADSMAKVTGEARYTADISLPNMLWGKILRSPLPHAKILNIETNKAERVPGVKAVVTSKDAPDVMYGVLVKDQTLFARQKVRYIGEPVAAVAATDKDIAEEALELIEVEYEELPAVFDPVEAMKEGAPIIHEHLQQYAVELSWWQPIRWGNVCSLIKIRQGDVQKGFEESDHILEDTFKTKCVHQCYMETHASLANFDASGRVTIWATSLAPFFSQLRVSKVLNIPMTKIRFISPTLGASYGGKYDDFIVPHCVLLSKKAKRAVKMVMSREEEFMAGTPRHPCIAELKTGVKKDGTLVARQIKLIYDTGAYADVGPMMVSFAMTFARGPYKIPNVFIDAYCVYTNKVVSGSFRGWGTPQVVYPSEAQMDSIAERIGMDPYDLRWKNAIEKGDTMITGQVLHNVGLKETLRGCTLQADYDGLKKKKKVGEGIGLACMDYNTGFASSSAIMKINEDGTFGLMVGSVDGGQGSSMALVQMAAEELGVPVEDVTMADVDTNSSPWDYGVIGSRTVFIVGNAVRVAAANLREQILEIASEMLKIPKEELEIKGREVRVKKTPKLTVSIAEVNNFSLWTKEGPIMGKGAFNPAVRLIDKKIAEGYAMPTLPGYIYATQIAQLEVDKELGKVKVSDIVAAHDCGKAINPLFVESQIQGAVAIGLGYALLEEVQFDMGRILNPSFTAYNVPTALDVPKIEALIVEVEESQGPFGAKGVGEPGLVPTTPAIANAISNALGIKIKDLPMTPEKVLEELRKK